MEAAAAAGWNSHLGMEGEMFDQWEVMEQQFTAQQIAELQQSLALSSEQQPPAGAATAAAAPLKPRKSLKTRNASSPSFLSFGRPDDLMSIDESFYGGLAPSVSPKKEMDLEAMFGQQASKCGASMAAKKPSHSNKEHIIAERKRREKLNQRFIALSAIVPGLKKVPPSLPNPKLSLSLSLSLNSQRADGQDLRSQRRHQVPEAAPGEGEVPGGASREEDRRVGVGPGQEVPPVRRRRRQPLLLLLRRLRLRFRLRRPARRRRVRAAGDRGQDLRQHHPRQDPLREAQGRAGEGALGDREHPPLRHQHQRHALHHFFARHNRHGSDRGGVRHDREGGCQETELSFQTAALKNSALVAENGKKGRLVTTNKKVNHSIPTPFSCCDSSSFSCRGWCFKFLSNKALEDWMI